MKKFIRITFLLFIQAVLLQAGYVQAEIILKNTHQNWESVVIVNNGQVELFRALTTYSKGDDYVVLVFDRSPRECDTQFVSMNVELPSPARSTYDSRPFFGALRVDRMPIHRINYTTSIKAGQEVAFFSFTNFENQESILDELVNGYTVRFKLSRGSDDLFINFSLLGFTAASKRTLEMCLEFNRERSDKDYF